MRHIFRRRDVLLGALTLPSLNSRIAAAAEFIPSVSGRVADSKAAVSALPFKIVQTPGVDALPTWQKLRTAGDGLPVVIGNDDALAAFAEEFANAALSPEEILERAGRLSFPDDLYALRRAHPDDRPPAPPTGDWPPGTLPSSGLSVAMDNALVPAAMVNIAILPTNEPTEVPAYLRWGGFNECPPPEYHVAALRSWRKRYGAEIIGANLDTLNIGVARRPSTRDEALALADEQYAYCEDLVQQGTQTLSILAASLMSDHWWYFWWD